LNVSRIHRLAEFLAGWTLDDYHPETKRPPPDVNEILLLQVLMWHVRTQIGKGNTQGVEKTIKDLFGHGSGLENMIDEIWNRYGTDEGFFTLISSMIVSTLNRH